MSNGAKQTWPALAESQITSHTVLTLCSGDAEQESATLTGCNWPGGRPEREAITSAALRGAARVIGSACQRRRCGITAAGKRCPLSPATHLQTTARTALARAMPSRGARQPGAGGSKSRLGWRARPDHCRGNPLHVMHAPTLPKFFQPTRLSTWNTNHSSWEGYPWQWW